MRLLLVGTQSLWGVLREVTGVTRKSQRIVHRKTVRMGHRTCLRNRHKSHLDRVHSSPHRHKPKKEYRNEGDKQGGPAEKPRPTLPTLKSGSFDGSTCLATFWPSLLTARNIISGQTVTSCATCVMPWKVGQVKFVGVGAELIKLLKNRYGTQDQTECYRLELKARKRRKNESLQSLYNDICRLMALAY